MRRGCTALVLAGWACVATTARADISYSYVSDQSSYTVTAGNSITVTIYLQEALTGSSTSLINANGGLYDAAVKASTTSGAGLTSITGATLNTTNFSPNVGNSSAAGATGYLYNQTNMNAAFANGPTTTIQNGATTDLLYLLGTFTITAGSTAGTTTYNLNPYSSKGGYTTTWTGPSPKGYYDLDFTNGTGSGGDTDQTYTGAFGNSPTSFTVTVLAVPEPSSLALCGITVLGGALAAYRRVRVRGRLLTIADLRLQIADFRKSAICNLQSAIANLQS